MNNFDDLAMAVASFGGNNKVIFDDVGMPSIMVGVPKMRYSDIITGGTSDILPWWIVDGVEKNVIWVSKYINTVVNSRAYSLPMRDPYANVTFDQALTYCKNKGNGWHLNQNGVFAALNLWSEKNGTIPRGNTNWDASYTNAYERGINTFIDGANKGGRTATGSGTVKWNHDWSSSGIADLCGNCWEWVSGSRLVDGEIQIIPYGNAMKMTTSMSASSTEWQAIMPDGTLVNPGTTGTLKIDRTSSSDATLRINTSVTTQTTNVNDTNVAFNAIMSVSGVQIPRILIAAGLFKDASQTAPGKFWARNNGERLPMRGSSFSNAADGGSVGIYLANSRSDSFGRLSFRSAFVDL